MEEELNPKLEKIRQKIMSLITRNTNGQPYYERVLVEGAKLVPKPELDNLMHPLEAEEKKVLLYHFTPSVEDALRATIGIPHMEEPSKKRTISLQAADHFSATDRLVSMCEWMNYGMQKHMAKYKTEDLNTKLINLIEISNCRRNSGIVPKLENFIIEFYLKAAKQAGFPISLNTDMGYEVKPPFYFVQESNQRINVYYSENKKTMDELKKEKPYTEINCLFELDSLIVIGEMNFKQYHDLGGMITSYHLGKKQQAVKALCELKDETPAFILFVQSDFFPEKSNPPPWLEKRLNDYEALNGQLVHTCVSYGKVKERLDSLRQDKTSPLSNAKA